MINAPVPDRGFAYYLRYVLAMVFGAACMALIALMVMGRLPFNQSIAGTPEGARALIESTAAQMVQVGEPALDNNRAMVYVRLAGRTCQFILHRAEEAQEAKGIGAFLMGRSNDTELYGWRISEQSCEPKLR